MSITKDFFKPGYYILVLLILLSLFSTCNAGTDEEDGETNNFHRFDFEPAFSMRKIRYYYAGSPKRFEIDRISSDLSISMNSGESTILTATYGLKSSFLFNLGFLKLNPTMNFGLAFTSKDDIDIDRREEVDVALKLSFIKNYSDWYFLVQRFRKKITNRRLSKNEYWGVGTGIFIPYDRDINFDIQGVLTFDNDDEFSAEYMGITDLFRPDEKNPIKIGDIEITEPEDFDAPFNKATGFALRGSAGFSTNLLEVPANFVVEAEWYKPKFNGESDFFTVSAQSYIKIYAKGKYSWSITTKLEYFIDLDKNQQFKLEDKEDPECFCKKIKVPVFENGQVKFEEARDQQFLFTIGINFTWGR